MVIGFSEIFSRKSNVQHSKPKHKTGVEKQNLKYKLTQRVYLGKII